MAFTFASVCITKSQVTPMCVAGPSRQLHYEIYAFKELIYEKDSLHAARHKTSNQLKSSERKKCYLIFVELIRVKEVKNHAPRKSTVITRVCDVAQALVALNPSTTVGWSALHWSSSCRHHCGLESQNLSFQTVLDIFILFYVYVRLCTRCMPDASGGHKKAHDPLELQLHLDGYDKPWRLGINPKSSCKSNKCSKLLSHYSSTHRLFLQILC